MKAPPGVARNQKPGWWASPFPTCVFRALNSRGKRILASRNVLSPALDIMTEGPLGGAAFNNEFGRPALTGYFRTYEEKVNSHNGEELRGYHKPIHAGGWDR
ncbi:phosphoribosylformylglycinamidine synthase [Salmonella enterica subsp. enterica]|uniref:Phosphoribosylformylglycinamidine synthase n=1 Tax=Salmonella enterica I TaxID=59201 RepID=A0A379W473_SALET|nr:phosphoribosylformylglycinamidine synthase [Salmonella enterica subsp. enterica]